MDKMERRKFMEDHCNQWQLSGLSKSAYCKQHKLIYHQFIWFAGKLDDKKSVPGFIKAESTPSKKLSGGITFHLRNGNYFTLPEGCSIQLVQQLIQLC